VRQSYEDLKQRSRARVADKLRHVIADYDGSARSAREVLRGLVAAADLEIDLSTFVRELGKRTRQVHPADGPKRKKVAS